MIKKKIILSVSTGILFSGIILNNWAQYIYHLADHQLRSIINREKITPELIETQNKTKQNSLKLIQEIKEAGEKMYGIKKSHSYEAFVELNREVLGWNLTAAPALELKAKEFKFPLVGKFGYLGFFSNELKEKWKEEFIKEGFDVYENQIGAYSTLGYFKDPVFSTYLGFNKNQMVRMVLHEMAHEKLYFKNDTDFSESLASFIEKPAANYFLYGTIETPKEIQKKSSQGRIEYEKFQDMLDIVRKELETVYSSSLSSEEKLAKKKEIFKGLYENLQKAAFKYLKKIKDIPAESLNNAFLVQSRRYSPSKQNGFKGLLDECEGNFKCWFENLKKLEKCTKDARKQFSTTEISLKETLKNCH